MFLIFWLIAWGQYGNTFVSNVLAFKIFNFWIQEDIFSKSKLVLFLLGIYIISGSLRKTILNWVENRLELLLYPLSGLVMDIKSGHSSPVMTDSPPISNSILTIRQNRLPYSSSAAATALSQNNNLFLTVPRKKTGILDDVKSSGWLDAMKSSSPPQQYLTKTTLAAMLLTWVIAIGRSVPYGFTFTVSCSVIFNYLIFFVLYLAAQVSISAYYFWENHEFCKREKNSIVSWLWRHPFAYSWGTWLRLHVKCCKLCFNFSFVSILNAKKKKILKICAIIIN